MNYIHLLSAELNKKRLFFIGLLMLPLLIFSQTEVQKDSIIVKAPEALQISEIANYGEDTRELIEDTEKLIEKKSKIAEINKELLKIDSIMETKLMLFRDTLAIFNLDQIDKLQDRIKIFNTSVELSQSRVNNWREQTDDTEKLLEFDTKVWELTSDSIISRENNFVDADSIKVATLNRVKTQVVANIDNLEIAKEGLKTWDEDLRGIENSISVTKGELNEAFSLLANKREKSIDNIWIPEYPPIWEMNADKKTEATSTSFKEYYNIKKKIVAKFLKEHNEIYYILVFFFLLIYGIILYLNIRAKKLFQQNPSVLVKGNLVLKHPFLSAMIILAFSIFLFFDFPIEIQNMVLLLLIIPFSVFIWERASKYKMYNTLFFITFSILILGLPVLGEDVIVLRYALFFINIFIFFLIMYVKSKKEFVAIENTYWLGTLPFLINLFIINTLIAFATNIIGSVQLSLLLTRTTIGTLISFIIIKEAVLLVQSFLYLVLMGPLFKYSNILKDDSEEVLDILNRILKYIAYLFWFYIILDLLKVRKSFVASILDFINTPLEVGELSISLGNILVFFIILQISIWISKFVRYFLDKEVYPRTRISVGAASTFSLLIKYSITFIGFLFALFGAGVELSKVAVGISALGIGVGFGLKNIVNNFVCGIILAIERPIKIGDIVEVDGVQGQVKDIGLRASQIRCWDGSDVLVPNDSLISGKLTNRTFDDRQRRLEVELKLDIDVDAKKVMDIAIKAAKTIPQLMKDPGPYANYDGIIDGKSVFKAYGWVSDYSIGRVVAIDLKIAVYKALKDEGIVMSAPVIDIKYLPKSMKE